LPTINHGRISRGYITYLLETRTSVMVTLHMVNYQNL